MKREIKFRAWEVNHKKMIDLHKLTPLATTIEGHDGLYIPFVDNLILMQYTGLLDKNGKEIWEGDLVELENWEPKRYEVVYNRGGFCLKFGEDSHFYPDIKYAEDSVVIGNIYESPELIK